MTQPSSSSRTVLITGATRGLGRAIALRLAKLNAHVIALARNTAALEVLDDDLKKNGAASTLLIPHDLNHVEALDPIASSLMERFGALDALVGNAAILGSLTPVTHLTPATVEGVMRVNFLANWRLLRACEPLLRQSKHGGHAVFMASSAAFSCPAYWGAYSASKAALESMVRTFVRETQESSLHTFMVDPGAIRTDLRAEAFPGELPHTVPEPDFVANRVVDIICGRHPRPSTTVVRF